MRKFNSNLVDYNAKEKIKNFWEAKFLCDFTIVVEGKEFRVHKLALASKFTYFEKLFKYETKETRENKITLEDMSLPMFKNLMEFCYSSSIEIDEENLAEILFAAIRFQSKELEEFCLDYIKDIVATSNCFTFNELATRFNLTDLKKMTFYYCLNYFYKVFKESRQEFLQMDEQSLIRLISNNQLNVKEESNVLEAVLEWVTFNRSHRSSSLRNLLVHVRFAFIKQVEIDHLLLGRKLVGESTITRKLDKITREIYKENKQFSLDKYEERQPFLGSFLIVGGNSHLAAATNRIDAWTPDLNHEIEFHSLTEARSNHGVIIDNQFLYVIGGCEAFIYSNEFKKLDLKRKIWHKLPAMRGKRAGIGVAIHRGFIYAIGGYSSTSSSLNQVERYDIERADGQEWELCKCMEVGRANPGVVVFDNLIYVLGGRSTNATKLNTVECYNPETNIWLTIETKMSVPRAYFGCIAFGGRIYAIGGCDAGVANNAEYFPPKTNTWTQIASMNKCRSGICLGEFNGLLYAVGGWDLLEKKNSNLIEAYDPVKDVWFETRPLIDARCGAAMAFYS